MVATANLLADNYNIPPESRMSREEIADAAEVDVAAAISSFENYTEDSTAPISND